MFSCPCELADKNNNIHKSEDQEIIHIGKRKENNVNRTTEVKLKTLKQSEMTFISNSRKQNNKECPNRSTNNGNMVQRLKRYVVYE